MSTVTTDAATRLLLLFRRAAFAAAALTFVVIVASAFMRHTQAGLACDDWPACYGRIVASAADGAPGTEPASSTGVRLARIAHRLAATSVLALVIGLLLVAWTQKPAWQRGGFLAAAALVVAGGLAVLGIATPGAMLPAVTLGNLLGGYLLLALLVATYASATREASVRPSADIGEAPRPVAHALDAAERVAVSAPNDLSRWIAVAALVVAFAQAWLGGTIGAQYALTACPTLGRCPGIAFDAVVASSAFDPFRPLSVAGGRVVPPADAAGVHVAHRVLGIVVAFMALIVANGLRRFAARAARLLVASAIAAPLLGAAAILALPSLPLAVLHNAAAAFTIAALAAAAARR